jgi:tRNA(Ile)-lysidine synthase
MAGGGRYIVAVSGGVDSVTLLHMLSKQPDIVLIVAHFDHGIRSDSPDDAAFVERLAASYGHTFESIREELGPDASEDIARTRRYAFLRQLAKRYKAQIMTAHHNDDTVETMAINVSRGTGWRGLAVLDSDVIRPLLRMSKDDIINYAHQNHLQWRNDSTNDSDIYLRNRIRRKITELSHDTKHELLGLHAHQINLKKQIDNEVRRIVGSGPAYNRYFFIHAHHVAALECLRFMTQAGLTRPQLERALIAVKTAKPGTVLQAGGGVKLHFTSRNFVIELIK